MDTYNKTLLEHYKHPQNFGTLPNATVTHTEENPLCADDLTLSLLIENNTLTDLRFSGKGCAISQGTMSLLSEQLKGKSISRIEQLQKKDILEILGVEVSERRMKCAMLGLFTLKNALQRFQNKKEIEWSVLLEGD